MCVGTGGPADAVDRLRARAPAKHALCGEVDGRVVWISGARLKGPLPRVGDGDAVDRLEQVPGSYRRALAALRVASEEPARWDDLRADRLLTALPPTAFDDVPDGVRRLLDGSHDQLALTLETYLDRAGDVKRTAADLWLHLTSLYYRLRRIEELAGVDLDRGEDRLLCHVALRLARLQRSA